MDQQYSIYASNKKEWEKACDENFRKEGKPSVKYIENAIIEPLKKYKENDLVMYRGGVCDSQCRFLAGLVRKEGPISMTHTNMCSYTQAVIEEWIDEDTIFGGEIINVFGHVLTETLCRCWILLQENIPEKILFTTTSKVPKYFYDFMSLLDIEKERIIVVHKVTQVKSILIPDQSLMLHSWYMEQWTAIYSHIGRNALRRLNRTVFPDKLYLTRSQLGRKDCIGEEYFENFYQKRGYEIVAPEKLPLVEQIGLFMHASEIVCTVGTLSHMMLFAKEETHLTLLLRNNEIGAVRPQILINQARKIKCDIIDVTMNILPTTHAGGVFYLGPTKHWLLYLKENNISYSEEEGQFDYNRIHEYLCIYAKYYVPDCYRYGRVKEKDMTDVIIQMNRVLLENSVSRATYATLSIPELKKQFADEKTLLNEVEKGTKILLPGFLRAIDMKDKKRSFVRHVKVLENVIECLKGNQTESCKILHVRYRPEGIIINDKIYTKNVFQERFSVKEEFILTLLAAKEMASNTDLVCFLTGEESIPFEGDDYNRFLASDITIGIFCEKKFKTTVAAQYIECHKEKSWRIMLEAVAKYRLMDMDNVKKYFSQNTFIQKHCFVTRSSVFHDYVEWISPILNHIVSCMAEGEWKLIYKLAERLFGAFLWIHKKDFKVGFIRYQ